MKYFGRTAKIGMVWAFLREGFNGVLMLPASMILARLLTPHEFGVVAAAVFFMDLAERLTALGFNAALVRLKQLRPEHTSSVFAVTLGLGCATALALTLAAPAFGTFFRSPETAVLLPIASLKFILAALGAIPLALLTRDMRFRAKAVADWITTATYVVVTIALAFYGFGFWSIVLGNLTKAAVWNGQLLYLARWRPSLRFSRAAMSDIFSFGMGVYVKGVLQYAAANLDNLVVGRMLGMAALGFYDKAFSLSGKLVSRLVLAGPSVSFRIFALIHEDEERFKRAYRKVVLSVTLVGYPALATAIIAAPELIGVLFGDQWRPAVVPFQILCTARLLTLLNAFASSALQAKGWIWTEVGRQALYTCLIVVAVAIGSAWGIAGAATGVLACCLFITVLLHAILLKATRLVWSDLTGPMVPGLIGGTAVAAILLPSAVLIRSHAGFAAQWQILGVLAAVAIGCFAGYVFLGPFTEVRALLDETLTDLAPGLKRWTERFRPAPVSSELPPV